MSNFFPGDVKLDQDQIIRDLAIARALEFYNDNRIKEVPTTDAILRVAATFERYIRDGANSTNTLKVVKP